MNLETLLYGFSVTEKQGAHRHCIDEHCLIKGTHHKGACITANLANYLSLHKSIPLSRSSDWTLLNNALRYPADLHNQDILDEFAKRTNSYGLRYSKHKDLGKSFVLQLLRSYRLFFKWDEFLWDNGLSPSRISQFEYQFLKLCEASERASSGEIYRLYDLLEGKEAVPKNFKLVELTSLFFAFGFSQQDFSKAFPKSIGELVAKYQFFYKFSKEAKEFIEKYMGFTTAAHLSYLKSSAPFVNKLWNYYAIVSSNIFNVDSNIANQANYHYLQKHLMTSPKSWISEDTQTIYNLKIAFTSAIQSKSLLNFTQVQQSVLPFRSNFEAIYHPFKHGDCCDRFFNRRKLSAFDAHLISDRDTFNYVQNNVFDYLHMIKDVMCSGRIVKIQPSQFNTGTTFKFQKEEIYQDKKQTFGVLVQCFPGGVSYLLTCY